MTSWIRAPTTTVKLRVEDRADSPIQETSLMKELSREGEAQAQVTRQEHPLWWREQTARIRGEAISLTRRRLMETLLPRKTSRAIIKYQSWKTRMSHICFPQTLKWLIWARVFQTSRPLWSSWLTHQWRELKKSLPQTLMWPILTTRWLKLQMSTWLMTMHKH
jgi:hypothetical protein